jgi:FAD:protein FMN transferase
LSEAIPLAEAWRTAVQTSDPVVGLCREGEGFVFRFSAMASPCEVRLDAADEAVVLAAGRAAEAEALRIERKFSRYREDSVVGRINASGGAPVEVDAETAHLFNFATQCFELSGGRFDITSGVLRRIWRFDGSDRLPNARQISEVRALVGWDKASWRAPVLTLPAGMEIDLGGIGKEYAVDRALALVQAIAPAPALVNFGGDLRVSGPRAGGAPWLVAIESVDAEGHAAGVLELHEGALATSGDARRFLLKDGIRYGHILDPRSGRPASGAPRSVTVASRTCVEAGMIATMAMLQGRRAEAFLKHEKVRAWCIR